MKKFINANLISLKCVLFLFLAGVGCLFPFLTLHVRAVKMTIHESCIISIVAAFISILGPLIAGPLADKLSIGRGSESNSSNGTDSNQGGNKVLRYMLATCLILSALCYGLLLAVPSVKHLEPRHPSVNFMCNPNGAIIYQEMCDDDQTCNHWSGLRKGLLNLSKCKFACESNPEAHMLLVSSSTTSTTPSNKDVGEDDDSFDEDSTGDIDGEVGPEAETPNEEEINKHQRRDVSTSDDSNLPHLCYNKDKDEPLVCYVYALSTAKININVTLLSSIDEETFYGNGNETAWCKYPLGGDFQCRIMQKQIEELTRDIDDNSTCNPVIECMVDDPYDPTSVLAKSQCKLYIGDPVGSFWMYLIFRSLGDIFATAAFSLLCTACVIATRETSLGRGDIGRQLVFGVIGMAIVPPLIGLIHKATGDAAPNYFVPFISMIILFVIAAIVMIIDKDMPLTPPEWWWHTKSGMLALPMNTIRRYSFEILAVCLVLITLGIFWSALDTYIAWTVHELKGNDLLMTITMTMGALPAIPVLWKAEQLVDYCGHSNIFIGAFTFYIIRFTGMGFMDSPLWVLFCEVFEVFTLSLMWVTAMFYFRHLVPRKYTATGQSLAVMSHFCIGRWFGALVGYVTTNNRFLPKIQWKYQVMAVAASVIGLIYATLYHFVLAPMCRETVMSPPNTLAMQGLGTNGNTNGSYTPLRVYHNERSRKGQFRY